MGFDKIKMNLVLGTADGTSSMPLVEEQHILTLFSCCQRQDVAGAPVLEFEKLYRYMIKQLFKTMLNNTIL